MSGRWLSSDRRAQLPANWQRLRHMVRDRAGGRCEALTDGVRCPNVGTDADHVANPANHHPSNLQWLCLPCHQVKTQQEARAGAAAKRDAARRPKTRHPGLA